MTSSSGSDIFEANGDEHVFAIPAKAVKTQQEMPLWEKSEAYMEYTGFIMSLNEAIRGKPLSYPVQESQAILDLVALLNKLDKMIDDTPPIDQPQRFGNQAFRQWYSNLQEIALDLLQEVIPVSLHSAVPEIRLYLIEAFGNATRIDYGTGHEMSFVMFMCCLFKIDYLKETDKVAAVTKVFHRYLEIVRKLQLTYRMEPAGSHGVWSLDDYQFVPFIWGSAQLFAHSIIEPSRFVEDAIINTYSKDYMFIGCIDYIRKVKTGLFAEHSNQLWSISGVSNWSKINAGLIKMYKKEVLGKFPVVQHILFGSLLRFKPVEIATKLRSTKLQYRPPPVFTPTTTMSAEEITERCRCRDVLQKIPSESSNVASPVSPSPPSSKKSVSSSSVSIEGEISVGSLREYSTGKEEGDYVVSMREPSLPGEISSTDEMSIDSSADYVSDHSDSKQKSDVPKETSKTSK